MNAEGSVVLDASALLALIRGEPGGEIVEPLVQQSAISSVNWSEVVQQLLAHGADVQGLRQDVEALGSRIVPFDADDADRAAYLWPETRSHGLSLGDRSCVALAERLGLPAVTADRVWEGLGLPIEIRVIR